MPNILKFFCALAASGLLGMGLPATAAERNAAWGSYARLFSADAPWNLRPLDAVLGEATIPTSSYFPAVSEGAYSVGVFAAVASDPPMVIKGLPGKPGVWDPDAEAVVPQVSLPHWPAGTLPATGSDGHADIVDPTSGLIHSFWQLRLVDGQWRAAQYAWTRLDGRGWADPAHYFQGARAAGVPASAGLIRKHEVDDGDTQYRHALAMSLAHNGLASQPIYVYPATSADSDAAQANTGAVPMGALLMLPPDFPTQQIASAALRKVAETLKTYGAYVVDRNTGTPFMIYVETGSGYNLHRKPDGSSGWNNQVADALQRIRANLRPVLGAKAWLNGQGQKAERDVPLNLLSMRGPWLRLEGGARPSFDTWRQAVVFPAGAGPSRAASDTRNKLAHATWAVPLPGQNLKLAVQGSAGTSLRLVLKACGTDNVAVDTGVVPVEQAASFAWPASVCSGQLVAATAGDAQQETWVRADLKALP